MSWLTEKSLFEASGRRAMFLASCGAVDFGECCYDWLDETLDDG